METAKRGRWELAATAMFVGVNIAAPLLWGEVYPFTISPMFCDQPQFYDVYQVRGPDDQVLDPVRFALQLEYDGNPPGFGAGITPRETLNQFGRRTAEEQITAHLQQCLAQETHLPLVTIARTTIGQVGNSVGIAEYKEWTVHRNAAE